MPADAVLIECGGDMLGANVPVFLKRLKRRRSHAKVILAAADELRALGATRMLKEMGLTTSLITGSDTEALRQRTETLCRIPALNMVGEACRLRNCRRSADSRPDACAQRPEKGKHRNFYVLANLSEVVA
jgi:hypothetical protein